jgi:hypothetical protein
MRKPDLSRRLRLGSIVFGVLVALEVTEYAVGVTMGSGAWPYLAMLAVIAAWPIVHYFMHITHLRPPRE